MFKKIPLFHLYAFLAVLGWSTSYVVSKLAVDTFSPAALSLIRCFTASLILALALLLQKTPLLPKLRDIPRFLPPGLIGLAIYFILFNQGTKRINPSTVCIIIATVPIIVPVIASFVFNERLTPSAWCATFTAFAGILIITLWNGTVDINHGVLYTAAAALCIAIYNILQRSLATSFPPLPATAYSFFIASAALMPCTPQTLSQIANAPIKITLMALFVGIVPTALSYLAWVKALTIAPNTASVTNYMFLTPLLSILFELLLLKSPPDLPTLLGGSLILLSQASMLRLTPATR